MPHPLEHKLRYNSDLHNKVRDAVLARESMSKRKMAERHPAWDRAEEDYRAYIPESVEDKRRKAQRSTGKRHYTDIFVSYSYASLLAAHTYWTSVFFSRTPVFQLQSRHGKGEMAALPMETLVDYQVSVGGHIIPYYVWLLDTGKYGLGVLGNHWLEERSVISSYEEEPAIDEETGLAIEGRTRTVKVQNEVEGYKGNKVFNIRPYDWLPDTRKSLSNFQKGEFCGHTTQEGWNAIVKDPRYFNREALRRMKTDNNASTRDNVGSAQIELPDVTTAMGFEDIKDPGSTELLVMGVELIPKDWGLDTDEYPEKWIFIIADKRIIIDARPMGHLHNQWPYDILLYEVDGYGLNPRGLMEIAQPVNDGLSWLVNSHFFNVRRALNDQVIMDPSRLNIKDMTDGGPGKIIRVRPSAYGQDPKTMFSQMVIPDITASHLRDTQMLSELMQRVTGVNDNIMGQVNPRGRKTATEIRTSSTFGINRLKTQAEFFSATGFQPLATKLIQNTQQYYDGTQMFRVAGTQAGELQYIEITPESIAGFYDFLPVDGTLPIDRFAQVALWKDFFATISQISPLLLEFDLGKLFGYVAQLAGLKNVDEFRVQSVEKGRLQAQVQQGNLVPIGGTNGGARGAGTPSVPTSGLG